MKKLILIFFIIAILTSCTNSGKRMESPLPDTSEKPIDIINVELTYKEYVPKDNIRPVFIDDISYSDNIICYEKNINGIKLYGLMDYEFNIISEPISDSPIIFNNGLAFIENNDEYQIIDIHMNVIDEMKSLIRYQDNWILVDTHNYIYYRRGSSSTKVKAGLFDFETLKNIDPEFYYTPIAVYNDPITGAAYETFKVAYVTLENRPIDGNLDNVTFEIPPIYERAGYFINDIAEVRKDGKWGYIDKEGNHILDCDYDMTFSFHDYSTIIGKKNPDADPPYNKLFAVVDREGNILTDFKYILVDEKFINGYNRVMLPNKKWNFIDLSGKELLNYPVYELGQFSNQRALITAGSINKSVSYFIDENGDKISNELYEDAKSFSDGYAAIKKFGLWCYINTSGGEIFKPAYTWAGDFDNGFALVKTEINSDNTSASGYLIDKASNTYLDDLDLTTISKFNTDGYALAYSDSETDTYYVIHITNLE